MTKPDFQAMTKQELRAYVLEHRQDEEAFHALVDRLSQNPGIEITSMEHLAQLIEKDRDKADIRDAHIALEEGSKTSVTSLDELKRRLNQ